MRNRFLYLAPVLGYLGHLFWIFGFVLLLPLVVLFLFEGAERPEVSYLCFVLPAFISWAIGLYLKYRWGGKGILSSRGSMLICALGWLAISAVGALPLWMGLDISYLDAYFEAVSGFTTTGITMLTGLDYMPRSLLFWRALIQWVGGLGILTFFLAVVFTGSSAQQLFSAETHKIFSERPAPGMFNTLRILWAIYTGFTLLIIGLLVLEGMSVYDAVAHSLTCLSTGGYSPYDASIAHYQNAGYAHYAAIEYTLTFGMLLGGMNFFVHYRVLTGGVEALWDNLEMRLFWGIVAVATLLVAGNHFLSFGLAEVAETVRHTIFQVVSILTTTGFGTKDIGADYFPALAKQIFLILMVIGGCVSSTGGGIKVMRIGVLFKMIWRQVRRIIYGPLATNLVLVEGEPVDVEEMRRIAALFFAWMVLLVGGGMVTALFSDYGPMESASGMFSALGNIGPCYISVKGMTQLHPVIKITYIFGMLAGRLEILPVLLLFSRRAWK